jgi:hypothetical protein
LDPVLLVSVPVIMETPDPVVPPVMLPVTSGADQLYVVPAGTIPFVPLIGVKLNEVPLQKDPVILVTAGNGFRVREIVKVLPVQVPDVGVTEYTAVCVVLLVFVKVPERAEPLPVAPPVKPEPVGAAQT